MTPRVEVIARAIAADPAFIRALSRSYPSKQSMLNTVAAAAAAVFDDQSRAGGE